MIVSILLGILIFVALFLAAPVMADLGALVRGLFFPRRGGPSDGGHSAPRFLFLVPAHDEEKLIARAVRSLRLQNYPADRLAILVVADNCTDRTAELAREAGAHVMERRDPERGGKHQAIGWALERISLGAYSAVVIVDADTVVEPDFAAALARRGPLEHKLVQARVGASNEDENWLTVLSAVLTVSRWDLALPLKERAGLNCPLTGDGTVIGTGILREYPWDVRTITEGWELYARFTTAGLAIEYAPDARLYAQEARELGQSRSQRERWTAGRLAVLRRFLPAILEEPGLPLLQRIDLVAELSSAGPVMRGFLGVAGAGLSLAAGSWVGVATAALFMAPVLQIGLYAGLAIPRMHSPGAVLKASAMLPLYAVWRVGVGVKAFFSSGRSRWVRTERHEEETSAERSTPQGAPLM